MNPQLKQDLMLLLAKIRQETGETYRAEIERLYRQLVYELYAYLKEPSCNP